jgi:hypothetical protein
MKHKLIFLTFLSTALSALSTEYFVDASRPNDTGSATNWATAKKTIQAAVDLTVNGDTVWVTNGIYLLSSEISVTNAITVQSVNGPEVTIFNGNGVFGCFSLNDSACTISGFTIANGFQGVRCADTTPVVVNCIIATNRADFSSGGGMFRGTAQNCIFRGNEAADGGGMAEGKSYNCTFIGNVANPFGGAIGANGYGGGQYGGETYNCLFIDNTAGMLGCTIASGTAYNCTFISTSCVDVYRSVVYNSVFSPEKGANAGSEFFSSCASDLINGVNGNITNAPMFVDEANGDFRLQEGSPCIGAGNNDYVQNATDLNGRDRILNGTVDMGAYEHLTAYVSADSGDDSNSGQVWADAKQTIQAAIDLTVNGDTVWVTNGTYLLSSEISVTNAITVQSVNGPEVTIVDGNSSTRCFYLSGECLVDGLTIRNGKATNGGGAFFNGGGTLNNCTLSGNSATGGGGAFLNGGGILNNCTLSGNCAEDGGFVIFGGGGGVYFYCGGTINNCKLVNNSAEANGGGAKLDYGGVLNNSVLSGNVAGNYGGGVLFSFGGTLNNCTVSKNSSGVAFLPGGVLNNSIIWGNTSFGSGSDILHPLPHFEQGIVRNACVSNGVVHGVDGCITNNPLFINEDGGDFRLQSNSPCINWGNNSVVSNTTDLAGNPRIVEGVVDMGAYEYQEVIGLADSDNDGINDDWERSHGGNQNPERTCSNGVNTILQAYIAGLDPHDPADKFSFLVDRSTPFGNVLRWQNVAGREYAVYYSTNLLNGFIPLIEHLVTGSGTYIDEVYEYDGPRYYKIDVQIDDNPDDNVTPPSPFI